MKSKAIFFAAASVILFSFSGCFLNQLKQQQPQEEIKVESEEDKALSDLEEKIEELEKQINDMDDFEIKVGEDVEGGDLSTTLEMTKDEGEMTKVEGDKTEDEGDNQADVDSFKQLFAGKFDESVENINIEISKNIGTHAQGLVGVEGEIGGGWFLAAKDANGEWVIAADGNGVVMCDLVAPYNFPSDMVPECWDEETQAVIFR